MTARFGNLARTCWTFLVFAAVLVLPLGAEEPSTPARPPGLGTAERSSAGPEAGTTGILPGTGWSEAITTGKETASEGDALSEDAFNARLEDAIRDYLRNHPDEIAAGLSGGYDRGFYLKSTKGPQDVKIKFLGQVWYDHIENDASYPPLNAEADYPSDGDSFILRRAEIAFSGHIVENVAWRLMIDPARAIGGRSPPLVIGAPTEAFLQNKRILQDVYIDYDFLRQEHCCWLLDSMSLRVGQFKAPQTDDGQRSSSLTEFPEKSIIGFLFGDTRSAGAMLFGTVWDKRLLYQAAVFNGNGRNVFRDESDDKDVIARLEYHPFAAALEEHAQWMRQIKARNPRAEPEPLPLRKLAFGVAGGTGRNGRADKTFHQDSFGFEFELEYTDYLFRAEWFRGKPIGSNLTTFPSNAAPQVRGWYLLAGRYLGSHWQVAVRYQEFDPNEDRPGDMVDVTTLGVSYFLATNDDHTWHGAKIQAAYNFNNIHSTPVATPTGFLANGDQFTLAFQVDF